jgi:hypothetical protein
MFLAHFDYLLDFAKHASYSANCLWTETIVWRSNSSIDVL